MCAALCVTAPFASAQSSFGAGASALDAILFDPPKIDPCKEALARLPEELVKQSALDGTPLDVPRAFLYICGAKLNELHIQARAARQTK